MVIHASTFTWLGLLRLVSVPLLGAFIGWVTNVVAIKMLFRPRRPIRVLGYPLQGLVPKRQDELAALIGQTIEKHLISRGDLEEILTRPETRDYIEQSIRTQVGAIIDAGIARLNPLVGIVRPVRDQIRERLLGEILAMLPGLATRVITHFESELDFRTIVTRKVRQFDLDRLEQMIYEVSDRELKTIMNLGGVLGFLIGLLQLGLAWLS